VATEVVEDLQVNGAALELIEDSDVIVAECPSMVKG
jgi:hypothetical protein